MTFVQIGIFDWLSGRQKGSIFVKLFKNLLLRNHIEDEAETWHTCLGYYPLKKLCFLFRSDINSGCYGNLKFPQTYTCNGKSGNRQFLPSHWGYLIFFTEMFIK